MAQDEEPEIEPDADFPPEVARTRPWRRLFAVFLILIGTAVLFAWLGREKIADDFIAGRLDELGLPATYEVARIGPGTQTLRNVVIGDPAQPDMTIERIDVKVTRTGFSPQIGRITLTRPRLFGTLRGSRMSFGSLDRVIYTGSDEPFALPDLDLRIVDGRALLESRYGAVGVKLDGEGRLPDGFRGEVAAMSDRLAAADCESGRASLYGTIATRDREPSFVGPLRLASLDCSEARLALRDVALEVDVTGGAQLDSAMGDVALRTSRLALGETALGATSGTVDIAWRSDDLSARYELAAKRLDSPQARLADMSLDGQLRASGGFARIEADGDLRGENLALGRDVAAQIATLETVTEGTLAADAIGQIAAALQRETRGSRLDARYIVRRSDEGTSVLLPRAMLRGGSGAALLALSRASLRTAGEGTPRLAGNFTTGGAGLPQISGSMEQGGDGRLTGRIAMREYRAGSARLALPQLRLVQAPGGEIGFAGQALVSGDLPGGRAQNLSIPLNGNWSAARGLALWRRCTDLGFDRLELANLSLERRRLTVCPSSAGAIVRSGPGGTRVAGGFQRLDLAGRLGSTPIRLRSGAVGFAMPGQFNARSVEVALGPASTASRFTIASLSGAVGESLAGKFSGTDILLNAVPLDLRDTSGTWRYRDGVLTLGDAAFRLEDREQVDRFQPLIARGASLRLADKFIVAEALLREPASEREVTRVDIRHDLATGRGRADLAVNGLIFDEAVQPDTLTPLALGVIANAKGMVRGTGEIVWDENAVTSTGAFTTDSLDFAAAFGPVKGLSGTVRFTDLLGLVTAPNQEFAIASANPGIEVTDGRIRFALQPDYLLSVAGAEWPFMGGTLRLLPTNQRLGSDETARYTVVLEGLDAAQFLARMEIGNLAATGIFDGEMPLVVDENGARVEGGMLVSREPGGSVSYVGELTYKDLSPIANFAFNALRALEYREMTIGLDGSLEGEIVTRVRMRGISQGEGTSSNFITRRIAKLPLQINVNLRAPFFQLINSFRSLYDPAFIRDPRELGLFQIPADQLRKPGEFIQPTDSETVP